MNIELHPSDWDDISSKLSAMNYSVVDLNAINTSLEDVETTINQYDVDHLITFSYSSQKSKLERLWSDLDDLQDYADTEPDHIVDNYDKPFNDNLDKYVDGMINLDSNSYETSNNLGVTEIGHHQIYGTNGWQSIATDDKKNKINLEDILTGSHTLSDILSNEWKKHKKKFHDDIDLETFESNEAKGYHGKEKVTREIANGMYETDGKYWINPWVTGFDITQMSTTSIITSGPHMSLGDPTRMQNSPHKLGDIEPYDGFKEVYDIDNRLKGHN